MISNKNPATSPRLPLIPAAFFCIVFGLAGLSNSRRSAVSVWQLPPIFGEAIGFAALAVWMIVTGLYALKWIFAAERARAEAEHPVQCCFIGLAGVSTMLIAIVLLPYRVRIAWVLFIAGALFTVLFAVWRTGSLWQGARDPATTTAVLYLPIVAGSFTTAIAASAVGHADWGQLAFGAGFFSWLAIESVLLNRMLTSQELAVPLRPTSASSLLRPPSAALHIWASQREHPTSSLMRCWGMPYFRHCFSRASFPGS